MGLRDVFKSAPKCSSCGSNPPGVNGLCGGCQRATGERPKNQLRTKKGREEQGKKR